MLLAAAGPTKGRRVTTHHDALGDLRASGARVGVKVERPTGRLTSSHEEASMAGKAVISLTAGLEDPERATVAFLVAVGAAGQDSQASCPSPRRRCISRSTVWRPAFACEGCPALPDLLSGPAGNGHNGHGPLGSVPQTHHGERVVRCRRCSERQGGGEALVSE